MKKINVSTRRRKVKKSCVTFLLCDLGWYVLVCVFAFFALTDRALTVPSNIRGCLSGTWSAGQENIRGTPTKLQREHENKTTNNKKKGIIVQSTCHKNPEGRSIETVWSTASRESCDTPPGSQLYRICTHIAFVPEGIVSRTPCSEGFRFLYRHSRCRLRSPWNGPFNAALQHLSPDTVTPGATSTFPACSPSLFLCRYSGAFLPSFTYAAINLQPPPHTVLYQTPGSSAAVLQSPVMPNSRRSSATQSVH